jgi:hypothetical protein
MDIFLVLMSAAGARPAQSVTNATAETAATQSLDMMYLPRCLAARTDLIVYSFADSPTELRDVKLKSGVRREFRPDRALARLQPPAPLDWTARFSEAAGMGVELNGIAHIQLTAIERASVPFWERLCHFLDMRTLIKGDDIVYCIGSRTGILVRADQEARGRGRFDQNRAGLHHLCFRARNREDVDAVHRFVVDELKALVVHPPEDAPHFAPGYYSVLFEDPDGVRVEVNHVPGKGHLGPEGRLGGGKGPAGSYGEGGLGG